ncbi:HAMP domain-containing histidine kinase [Aquibacillus koreensis]|uniref:histidine kinase n=1 Tax=Aquibacillus koreensis TaxID=279446 RepID=A0A9X3WLW9_9BACI|nr:HAMP domain-containing sensor histidine kinase [Aquibacillus koreensis]MCT2535164.1 HAMP domain-containing histidine kinase [Aquibacillus koreensis]MDC3421023.1 HAMP domain-containing histidine kinase [Aquibacillus koreensis]
MDIKWRNSLKVFGWSVLFTFGLSGLLSFLNYSNFFILTGRYDQQMLYWTYAALSIVALIISVLLLKKMNGIPSELDVLKLYYQKLTIDIRVGDLILSVLLYLFLMHDFKWKIVQTFDFNTAYISDVVGLILFASFIFLLVITQVKFLLDELKDVEHLKTQWKHALIHKGMKNLQDVFLNRKTGTQLFLLLAVVFCFGVGTFIMLVDPFFILVYFFLGLVIGLPVFIVLVKRVGEFNRILEKTSELVAGKHGDDLKVKGKSVMAKLAGNINTLKHGVRVSQNEQAKSERLKTELVTNVSHDLRTPLTSIITYTELLKTGGISKEEQASYVEIIDQKSKRLKVLIDDLFEVSKMASGNMELTKSKVDLVQLLQQALAEHDNTIRESSLQFRVLNAEKPIYTIVDGQKLWRVFDNLISNILKYSMENSRVYISTTTMEDQAHITFKNMSKYELNDNSEELFERFKRADASRHTDGSGLGLAIAKSIVDLHEGTLDIETDGDLFKVSITLQRV